MYQRPSFRPSFFEAFAFLAILMLIIYTVFSNVNHTPNPFQSFFLYQLFYSFFSVSHAGPKTQTSLFVPQPSFHVWCHAPISPIRQGNEARKQCKYAGPLVAPWLITHRRMQRDARASREWEQRDTMAWWEKYIGEKVQPTGTKHKIAGRFVKAKCTVKLSPLKLNNKKNRSFWWYCLTIIQPTRLIQRFWAVILFSSIVHLQLAWLYSRLYYWVFTNEKLPAACALSVQWKQINKTITR